MKAYLESVIAKKNQQVDDLKKEIRASQDADEVRALGDTLQAVLEELQDAQDQLDALENGGEESTESEAAADDDDEEETASTRSKLQLHSVSKYTTPEVRSNDYRGSMEYRKAFKDYIQRGTTIPRNMLTRAAGDAGITVTDEIGAIIPTTVMEELIRDVQGTYGQIYSKVRKLNIKGGVQFPISSLSATMTWIPETEPSDRVKAGDINDSVIFSYNAAEIKISVSLIAQTVSLDLFEEEIARIIAEAYMKAMDTAIINGTGSGQPLGIVNDPRVTNVVEFTADELSDWKQWRKKLFSQIPLAKRANGEFYFTASTVESNLLTMADDNNRPLFKEATEGAIDNTALYGTFFGRDVTLVEPDILADADTAADGDVIGIYTNPNDYAVNTNLEFNIRRYFDEDTNEYVTKGITIVDGKMLDTTGTYLIKLSSGEDTTEEETSEE